MKIYCRGEYHNGPLGFHFDKPGVIEVDQWKADFLLRDAPENFTTELPAADERTEKSMDVPPLDKQVKAAPKKK